MSKEKSHIDQIILDRLKKAYNLPTDADLADFLGVKANTIATWKRRDSYNLELILSKCDGLSANWLLFGEGPMWKNEINEMGDQSDVSDLVDSFEQKAVDLIQRVENGPWRVETKLQLIESMIKIVQDELKDLKKEP